MASVLLIRHGETEWNLVNRIQGSSDSPLTAKGQAQAKALADRLAAEAIDALHVSDLGRTRQTADPIAAALGLAPVLEPALRERNYGAWEGLTFAEARLEYPQEYERFSSHDPYSAAPRGESALQFQQRIVGALTRLAQDYRGKRVAVVTHGGPLGVMYRWAMALGLDAPRNYSIANASINRLSFDGTYWRIERWGEVDHLPPDIRQDSKKVEPAAR